MGALPTLVSVLLPTRNRLAFLGASIGSVLSQDYGDLELIVVDDDSSDGTTEYLSSLTDPRLRVLRNSSSLGPAGARNRAIEVAAGELIAFQDSDDIWRAGKLRRQVDALQEAGPECVVAYGPMDMPGVGRIPGPCDEQRSGDLRSVLVRYNIVGLPTAIVRADALHSGGQFDRRLHRLEDWDIFLSLSKIGTFAYTDELLIDIGVGNERVSSREPEYYDALTLVLHKHADLFRSQPILRAAHRLQLARRAAADHRPLALVEHLVRLLGQPTASLGALAARGRTGWPLDRGRCCRVA